MNWVGHVWWWHATVSRRWVTGWVLVGPAIGLLACATINNGLSGQQLRGVVRIAAGSTHTCVVTAEGYARCWGANQYGQLGDGSHAPKRVPIDVSGLMGPVKDIAVGERHTCAVTTTASLKCWGSNHDYQLGDGVRQDRVSPFDVTELRSDVRAVTAGELHTCVLTATGGVKCWGGNQDGQLGEGTSVDKSQTVEPAGLESGVLAVAAGWRHTCVLTAGGAVKCWGNNQDGQIGDGTTVQKSIPTDVVGLGSGVSAIAAGGRHTCAVLAAGGVKCWGQNLRGQLGDGTTVDRVTPATVAGLTGGVSAITAGWQHTCALVTTGTIKCWGNNAKGQLGDGTLFVKVTATDVAWVPTTAIAVTAGRDHTCALSTDNAVSCWGDNESAQLGEGVKATQRIL